MWFEGVRADLGSGASNRSMVRTGDGPALALGPGPARIDRDGTMVLLIPALVA